MPTPDPKPTGPVIPSPEADDPDGEVLDTGQEEVFSRAEIEGGVSEHAARAGSKRPDKA